MLPPFRFYIVGEYGPTTIRPHYHAILFGVSAYQFLRVNYQKGKTKFQRDKKGIPLILNAKYWPFGSVDVDPINPASIKYVCGYVKRKLIAKKDPRLKNLNPEFHAMSLRPGIGAKRVRELAREQQSKLKCLGMEDHYYRNGSPRALRHGKIFKPLGRYLSKQMEKEICASLGRVDGWKVEEIPRFKQFRKSNQNAIEMRSMFEEIIARKGWSKLRAEIIDKVEVICKREQEREEKWTTVRTL